MAVTEDRLKARLEFAEQAYKIFAKRAVKSIPDGIEPGTPEHEAYVTKKFGELLAEQDAADGKEAGETLKALMEGLFNKVSDNAKAEYEAEQREKKGAANSHSIMPSFLRDGLAKLTSKKKTTLLVEG